MTFVVRATCCKCGDVTLPTDDVMVLRSTGVAVFNHCNTEHETRRLGPDMSLMLAIAGCMEADARDVEAALAGGGL